jgi:cytosine/adenosine deaminase-related metal-dependent hydrolase
MSGRTIIQHLDWVITVDPRDSVIRDATVVLDGDRLTALGPSRELGLRFTPADGDEVIDGRGRGMCPGFVDTHVHLVETLARAHFPDRCATPAWVFHWAKPWYAAMSEDDEHVAALLACAEMARCGTTSFLDMGASNDPRGTVQAIAQVGLRGVTGRFAADVKPDVIPRGWSPEMVDHHFFPDAETALDVLEQCVRDYDGAADGRIRCWVNIEGKEPCSQELHVGARELAARLGVGTSYHCASSVREARLSEERYGVWPITRIGRNGGLGPNLVLAHATATHPDEVPLLAEYGTSVAFCPVSALKLAKGATKTGRFPELRDAGVAVGLGTDGAAASGNFNLHRQMFVMAGIYKDSRADENQPGAVEALRMCTIDGARALGWDADVGSLEPGKKADLLLYDLDHWEWVPHHDPIQALVWSASSASLTQTWVDGRRVYAGGAVTGIDETSLHAEARARSLAVRERSGLDEHEVPLTTTLY